MLATAIAAPKISVDTFAIFLLRDVIDAQKIGLLAANSNHTFLSIVLQSNPLMHFALGAADSGEYCQAAGIAAAAAELGNRLKNRISARHTFHRSNAHSGWDWVRLNNAPHMISRNQPR